MELFPALTENFSRREFAVTGAELVVGAIAAVVIAACVLFHYEVMSFTSRRLPLVRMPRRARIVGLILAMLAAHVVEVWISG